MSNSGIDFVDQKRKFKVDMNFNTPAAMAASSHKSIKITKALLRAMFTTALGGLLSGFNIIVVAGCRQQLKELFQLISLDFKTSNEYAREKNRLYCEWRRSNAVTNGLHTILEIHDLLQP